MRSDDMAHHSYVDMSCYMMLSYDIMLSCGGVVVTFFSASSAGLFLSIFLSSLRVSSPAFSFLAVMSARLSSLLIASIRSLRLVGVMP